MSGFRVDFPVEGTALRPGGLDGLDRIGGEGGFGSPRIDETTQGASFSSVLEKTVEAANLKEKDAVHKAEELAAGRLDDLHGTMIAMKEADISLKLVGTVRNKLLDAFHELWRTSV